MPRIYIADLHAYNNGKLVGKWVELPCEEEELDEVIAELSHDGMYDIAIHDSELPFDIDENDSPTRINEIIQYLEDNDIDLDSINNNINNYNLESALSQIRDIAYHLENKGNYSALELCDEYIDYDTANEMAKNQLESGGLARLYYFMGEVNFHSEDIYRINGYGNLESVTKESIEGLYEEVVDMLLSEI